MTLSLLGVAFAQGEKVATATSKATFQLKGAPVDPSGVPNWPVNFGDEIVAGTALVTLTMADGSTVSLSPGSRGVVTMKDGKPNFKLTSGEALYVLKTTDAVKLYALDKAVRPTGLQGHYSLGGTRAGAAGAAAGATYWTAGHIALVTLAVAGAGIGIGVGVANANDSGTPVSGSK